MNAHVTLAALGALANLLVQVPDAAAQDGGEGRITFAEPPFDVPAPLRDSIRFGFLTVPEDHEDSASGVFRLALMILPARAPSPEGDPIVFIPGGPGMSVIEPWAVEAARAERIHLLRERRDFIIFEPRGHGLSEPHTCPELNGAAPPVTTSPAAEANLATALEKCRVTMSAAGVRLRTLSAVQVAKDLELLRRALEAPHLNLLGVSYGSRLAAEAMRTVPAAIRSAALIGPVPAAQPRHVDDPALARARLGALFERCRQQAACNDAFPALVAEYDTVLARARREPLTVPLAQTPQLPDGRLVLDESALQSAFAALLFERRLAANAPLLIHTLASRGLDPLVPLAPTIVSTIDNSAESFGTFLSFECNDAPAADTAYWFRGRCAAWLGEGSGDRRTEPVRSDIPALVMAGEFDPRTPPEYARLVAAGLTRATVLEIPWHGHEYALPCINRIERDFFESPERAPPAGCLDSLPSLAFVSGVVPSRWTSGIAIRAASNPMRIAAVACVAFVLLFVSVIWVSTAELRQRPGVPDRERRASFALLLSAMTGIIFVCATVGALIAGWRHGFLVPALGVPDAWAWVLLLPWVLGAAAIAAALVFLRRLRTREVAGSALAACVLAGTLLLVSALVWT